LTPEEAEAAAKSLNKAVRGVGIEESRLIKEIVCHSNLQRQMIKVKYTNLYGKV
jgi:hypothetical protein